MVQSAVKIGEICNDGTPAVAMISNRGDALNAAIEKTVPDYCKSTACLQVSFKPF